MVSIDDCSSKCRLQQPLKSEGRLHKDNKSPNTEQRTGKENEVPLIIAKSIIAAKIQIFSEMGNHGKAMFRHELPIDRTETPGSLSMKKRGIDEDILMGNLKAIVADDGSWDLFAVGAIGLQPNTRVCDTLRDCLQKGFKEDTWDGIDNLVSLYSESVSTDENNGTFALTDDLSSGLIERTKLWLTYTDYFETLFSVVREKNLSDNIDLYTDIRLIRYLDTIGQ